MAENKLADLSMDFAVSILKVTDGIKGHYSLINQLERSANLSVLIFVKQNMLKVKLTLYPNFKLH